MWEMGSFCLHDIKYESECLRTFQIIKEWQGLVPGWEKREGNFHLSVNQSVLTLWQLQSLNHRLRFMRQVSLTGQQQK